MISKNDISNLKNEIGQHIGRKIIIRGEVGRRKYFEEEAVLESTYSNIFIVKRSKQETNASFRYTDVLTNDLQILLPNENGYSPLVPAELKSNF